MPTPKITVFVDYQNAHLGGHHQFCGAFDSIEDCLLDPLKLAECLVSKRAPGGVIERVLVYRGRSDARKEQRLTQATDRQWQVWTADPRVQVKRRALWYPEDFGQPGCQERPREKGIDVALAIDLVRMALKKEFEVGILFSRDQDLLPAVEMAFELERAHVEVGTWEGASRLRLHHGGKGLWCHVLEEDDFRACRDPRPY